MRSPASLATKEFTPSAATTTMGPQFVVTGLDADDPRPGLSSVSTRSTRTPGMIMAPASSHFAASHASSLARNTVTALTGSASRASL